MEGFSPSNVTMPTLEEEMVQNSLLRLERLEQDRENHEAALEQAGRMKQKVRLYLLLPKAVAERRKTTS